VGRGEFEQADFVRGHAPTRYRPDAPHFIEKLIFEKK
jgi:hypothetical protein